MPALEGQFLKEIAVRFAGENHLRTQKNTKQSSAQRFLNDPFPRPLFSAADLVQSIEYAEHADQPWHAAKLRRKRKKKRTCGRSERKKKKEIGKGGFVRGGFG